MGVFGIPAGGPPKKPGFLSRVIGTLFGRGGGQPVWRKQGTSSQPEPQTRKVGTSGDTRDSRPPRSGAEQRAPDQREAEQRFPGVDVGGPSPYRNKTPLPFPYSLDPNSPAARFLRGEWISVTSSNVDRIYYDLDKNTLRVVFNDQNEYHVWPISPDEAVSFLRAPSKGGWYWDNVRIRGTALGHKKFYIHVGLNVADGKDADVRERQWIETPNSMLEHLLQVGQESGARGYDVVGTIPDSVPYDFFLTESPRFPGSA